MKRLILAAAIFFAACRTPAPLSPQEQSERAVLVVSECGVGSGFLFDDDLVLTAEHVVSCSNPVIIVKGETTPAVFATVEGTNDDDTATLRLAEPLMVVEPPPHGSAGPVICMETSFPTKVRKCAAVKQSLPGMWNMRYAKVSEPGNSGSALFNLSGELVGVHTCGFPTFSCGTRIERE